MSELGAFAIGPYKQGDMEILLSWVPGRPVSQKQRTLLTELVGMQRHIRDLYPPTGSPGDLLHYYNHRLHGVASIGLNANLTEVDPDVAADLLVGIRNDIVMRESGARKNGYLVQLGGWAAAISGLFLLVGTFADDGTKLKFGAWMLSATMPGVWVSYIVRKPIYTIEDLIRPEADYLHPVTRLVFVALLTVGLSLLLGGGALGIKIGSLDFGNVYYSETVCVLFGFICGFGEQVLGSRFGVQASKVLDAFGK